MSYSTRTAGYGGCFYSRFSLGYNPREYLSYDRAMMNKSYVSGPSRYKTGISYVDKTFFDQYM